MEEYKDVMLSEPPSRFTAAPAVQTTSLENYKGILLCDRPANAKPVTDNGAPPFLPAGRGDDRYVGMQPSVEQRSRYELTRSVRQNTRIAKPSAVTRHRRWLKSFAGAVKQMKLDKAEADLDLAERGQKLRDEQAELRRRRKENLDTMAAQQREQQLQQQQQPEPIEEVPQPLVSDVMPPTPPSVSNASISSATKKKKSGKKEKPKWAMTEDEALDAELDEHNHLMDFANQLDYGKFIEDYQVREALAIMRDRVKEIADEKGIDLADAVKDEDDDADETSSIAASQASTTTREVRRLQKMEEMLKLADTSAAEHTQEWNSSTKVAQNKLRKALNSEALQLAERILGASESMGQVYTKQSLAKMLEDATMGRELREEVAQRRAAASSAVPALPPVVPPVVSQISAESGPAEGQKQKRVLTELRHSKTHVQNLPYMYRCPSL